VAEQKRTQRDNQLADKREWNLVVKGSHSKEEGDGEGDDENEEEQARRKEKNKKGDIKGRPFGGKHGRAEKVLVPLDLARRILERGGGTVEPWFITFPRRIKHMKVVLMQKTIQAFCMRCCLAGARRNVQQYVHSLRQEGGMEKFIIEYSCEYDVQDRKGHWYKCGKRGFYSINEIEAHAKHHRDEEEAARLRQVAASENWKEEVNK
jgi:hypothetical protein